MKHTYFLYIFDSEVYRFAVVRFGLLFLFVLIHATMAGKEELQTVIQGNGLFTKQLYNVLSKKEGNVFFSPISAHAVLSMAYQGSKGSTYEAFTKTLNVPNHNLAAKGYNDVLGQLNNISGVELSMANKIYVKTGYLLKPNFQEITAKHFLSTVEAINFAESEKAAKSINSWVEEKTKDKIKDLVQPSDLDETTRLVLLNAIYFKGNWAAKFDPARTEIDKFYVNDTESVDVQMMWNKDKYNYKEDRNLNAKVLELPYSNPDISMIIILPNKRNGIAELEEKLAQVDLTKITEDMYKPEVIVRLPKFKIETTIDLVEPLEKLGLGVIFKDNEANFTEMLQSPEPLVVSKVIQKAFIEVNEEGTEAAAATSAMIEFRCLPIFEEFTVDHPFLIALVANQHDFDNILFTGRIINPQQ